MNRVFRSIPLLAFLLSGSAASLAAQGMVLQVPPALEENDPRGAVVRGLYPPILEGNRAAAQSYLLKNAAEGYEAAQAGAQLAEVFAKIEGEFEVPTLRQGPQGEVLVPLLKKGEQGLPTWILVVELEPTAPHRITSLRLAVPQVRTGG